MTEKLMGSKVLVTGASGFIGRNLCDKLLELGVEVHGIFRKSKTQRNERITWWQGNLNNLDYVRLLVKSINPDYIIHLAGHSVGHKNKEEIIPSLDGNLLITINLLLACLEVNCRKIILPGSMEEPQANGKPPVPASPYAAAKLSASIYARMFHSLYNCPVVIARIFMVYGPGQVNKNKLLPHTILSALKNKPLSFSSGMRKIDWIFIDDAVEGLIRILLEENTNGKTIDIGSGSLMSVRQMVERTLALIDNSQKPVFEVLIDRPKERVATANVEETFKLLNWKPQTNVETGLLKTIDYYRSLTLQIILLAHGFADTSLAFA